MGHHQPLDEGVKEAWAADGVPVIAPGCSSSLVSTPFTKRCEWHVLMWFLKPAVLDVSPRGISVLHRRHTAVPTMRMRV
jgi:hypothetical protein